MEYGWIEAVHKNKLIVVPQKGKNQFLPENRIAFSWRGEKLAYNANQAHELLAVSYTHLTLPPNREV